MASLLRTTAIRRALSAASSGGQHGASFRRAPLAATPVFGGEGGATLALSTGPRRHLSGSPPAGGNPPNSTANQIDMLRQSVKQLKVTVDKGFVVSGSIRLVLEDCKAQGAFRLASQMVGVVTLILFVEQRMKSAKQE